MLWQRMPLCDLCDFNFVFLVVKSGCWIQDTGYKVTECKMI